MTFTDTHSYANPEQVRVTHLDWEANVDFERKIIDAKAVLSLDRSDDADTLVLDTHRLVINEVTYASGEKAVFRKGEDDALLGSALRIALKPETEKVIISYSTAPDAPALQWLTPMQTSGGTSPFLFTQSQAILARTWIPLQDSPGIRFTYTAKVKVPSGMLALMSAQNPMEKSADGSYSFTMDQPIPAYLMALAVGDLEFARLGERSGVYAEPSVIDTAAYEFAELEDMISAAEDLYGSYQWGRYDLLVLPPSFPFGGMENPRLTFATPTILAGDRSLTSLIAHELAHSWSGNLVTNATWNDFWLNEGFTVYFEQRIMEKLYGASYSEMLASLETEDLKKEISELTSRGKESDTHLKLDLDGRNPDEGMTDIAYVKGYLFLRYLENEAGRETFDRFLRNYFERNAFNVMTTEAFLQEVNDYLIAPERLNVGMVKLKEWVYNPGLPGDAVFPESDRFGLVDEQRENFMNGMPPEELETTEWSSHEWVRFVRSLPVNIGKHKMADLDSTFRLTDTGNSELLSAWLELAIKAKYKPADERLESFLINTGRRKFLMPLYTALVATYPDKKMALEIYEKARPNYHYVSYKSIDDLLNYEKSN